MAEAADTPALASGEEPASRRVAVARIFQQALALHRQGRAGEAEPLYRAVLRLDGGHFGTLHNLGLLSSEAGRRMEAVEWLRAALAREPNSADAHGNLGTVLAALDRHEEAIGAYEKALGLAPRDVDTRINLGASLHALGRHGDAIGHFEAALAAKPASAEARNNLGNALMALGRKDDAIIHYVEALRLRPGFAEAHNNLGRALAALDRTGEAIAHYEKAVGLKPTYLAARENLALALIAAEREREAIPHLEAVLSIEPRRAETHNMLGQILAKLHRNEKAADHFRAALASRAGFVQAHVNLGGILNSLERPAEAIDEFGRALAIDPECAGAYDGIGASKQMLGFLPEARQAFERAVALAPRAPEHYQGLAEIKRFTADDPHLAAMEDLARDPSSLSTEQRIALDFALGKAYGDIGNYERSCAHLLHGNALKRAKLDYDEAATLDMFPHIEKVFSADLLRRTEGLGDTSTVPILILGMPRSGTTLLEQMLASHSAVHGAGELGWVDVEARKFRGGDARGYFPEVAATLSSDQLRDLGARYVEFLRSKSATAAHVTDKAPMNFRFIGLIHMMLPNVRIVHARRDPVDTCLSCFTKNFSNGIGYAFDLAELGRYWRAYDRLMTHWRRVLPEGVMLDVQYEELVADFEGGARRVIAFCGLEWEESCLAFHQTQRPVRTASVNQVRRPVYQSSVGRWRPYEKMLAPLLKELRSADGGAARISGRLPGVESFTCGEEAARDTD